MIKALILDLDNTIFPTASIGYNLFKPLYALFEEYKHEISDEDLPEIKLKLMKKAFQLIAEEYKFSDELIEKGTALLRTLSYDYPTQAFADYPLTQNFKGDKFLVTMGFTKMQETKVRMLDIGTHFKEVIVNDPDNSEKTKKDIFQELITKYSYQPQEVLVIGDDPDSEIKAGKELQMPTVLYDKSNEHEDGIAQHHINDYSQLQAIIDEYDK